MGSFLRNVAALEQQVLALFSLPAYYVVFFAMVFFIPLTRYDLTVFSFINLFHHL